MGFNQDDADTLEVCRTYFNNICYGLQNDWQELSKFEIDGVPGTADDAGLLASGIEAYQRYEHNMTVWLEVLAPEIPPFLEQAVRRVAGIGVAIVVTQGNKSTATEPGSFPASLIAAIKAAKRFGQVFDPLLNRAVEIARE